MKNGSTETKIITVDSAVKESGRNRIGNIAIIGILSWTDCRNTGRAY